MKKLLLSLTLALPASFSTLLACCMGEPHTLTELLLHDERDRSVFLCEVISSAATMQGMYFSKVKIREVFKGEMSEKTVFVYTGGNTSAGGISIQANTSWVIFSRKEFDGNYAAKVCDHFSCCIVADDAVSTNRLQLVTDFRRLVKTAYTGPVTWYYPDGIKAAEGQFLNGKPEGIWLHYRYDGTLKSETPYQNGVRHGTVVEILENERGTKHFTYQNGRLLRQISNYNNSPNQIKSEANTLERDAILSRTHTHTWYPNGILSLDYTRENTHIGEYSGFIGPFIKQDSTGKILDQGAYFLGAKTGKWVETDPKTKQQRDTIYPPRAVSAYDFVRFYEDGRSAILGNLKDGLPEGKWFFFRQNGGASRASTFKAGKLSGEEFYYHYRTDMVFKRNFYVNGLLDGEQLEYFENGAPHERVTYKMGVKDGPSIQYLESGVEQVKSNYRNGKLQGEYLGRDMQGDTSLVAHFDEDAMTGPVTLYTKTKKRCEKSEGQCEHGVKTGEWKFYDCQGNLIETCWFDGRISELNTLGSDYKPKATKRN